MESSSSQPQNMDDSLSLSQQFSTVLDKELETRKKYEESILQLSASAEEVLSWWKSRDPLLETSEKILKSIPHDMINDQIQKEFRLFLHGGLLLLMGTMCEHPENQHVLKWNYELRKNSSKNIDELFLIAAKSLDELLTKLKKEQQIAFTFDDLERLYICAEMMATGSRLNNIDVDRLDYLEQVIKIIIHTLDIVSSYKSTPEPPNSKVEDQVLLDEVRILALKACLLQNALVENRPESIGSNANKALSSLLDDLYSLFVETSETNTIWKRLKQPIIKGFLHEILWYLDFIMFRHTHPEKYSKVNIMPSFSFADRPEIGKPEHNRAYDFYIADRRNAGIERDINFVQLKSSQQSEKKPGSNKKYHPLITVVEEQNFMDVNPARLRAKINIYKQILDNGFRQEDREKLDKYTLPTVKSYLEKLNQI